MKQLIGRRIKIKNKDKLKIELNAEQPSSNKYKQYLNLSFFPVVAGRNTEAALNLGTLIVGNYALLGADNKSISSLDEYIQYYAKAFPDERRTTHKNNGLNWFCDLKPSKTINESAKMKTCITEENKNLYSFDFLFDKNGNDYFTENEFDKLVDSFKFTDPTADWQVFDEEKNGVKIGVLTNFKYPKNWYTYNFAGGTTVQIFFSDGGNFVNKNFNNIEIINKLYSTEPNIAIAENQKRKNNNECEFSVLYDGSKSLYSIRKFNTKDSNILKQNCETMLTGLEEQTPINKR
ncbi:MAG: hypothetical protein Q7R92_02395 [bacterium]|nr:hypothetical protein [bacterium]